MRMTRAIGLFGCATGVGSIVSSKSAARALCAAAVLGTAGAAGAQAVDFRVGESVEIEASKHWVPCTVTEPGPQVVRVRCTAYPALSRAAGAYIAQNDPSSIRRPGAATRVAAPARPRAAAPQFSGLKTGEYACYGSGGRIMVGLGFKVTGPGRYTDLDGKNPGTFSVSGGGVSFRGGHLGGQSGRDLRNGYFRIGAQAACEPY